MNKSKLFCFTPEVMLTTFLIEIFLAIYVFIRYRMTDFGKASAATLIFLALFQAAEYKICAGDNIIFWSRFGFAAITVLPVLGLYLISLITGKKHFLKFGYALMLAFILIFIFTPKSITGANCAGNYVIFSSRQELAWTYGAYYFGFLFLAIWEAIEYIKDAGAEFKNNKKLLYWMIAGYFSFMLPMEVVYLLSVDARRAVPSIMCGFAVILALLLAIKITPLYHKNKNAVKLI